MSGGACGVLLMAYGAPGSPEEVPAFLQDIFGSRPVPEAVAAEVVERYRRIGGRSPLSDITSAQAHALQARLGRRFKVVSGMRHWAPRIRSAVEAIVQFGCRRLVALPLTPYFSHLSVGAYMEALGAALSSVKPDLQVLAVDDWSAHPGLIAAFAAKAGAALTELPAHVRDSACLVLSAHSLPAGLVGAEDPYPDQVRAVAGAVAQACGAPSWELAYQSRALSGARDWLGPDVAEVLRGLPGRGIRGVALSPIGFLSDNLETLYDQDVQYRQQAEALGLHFVRAKALNDDPALIEVLAQVVTSPAGAGMSAKVLIAGGGIAGLSCAYDLARAGREFVLLEASPRLGGKILSESRGATVIEGGPDSFLTAKPAALRLVRELGLEAGLLPTDDTRKSVFVYSRGRLRRMPGGAMLMAPTALLPFLAGDLVSWGAKLRMLLEPLVPRGDLSQDESIAEFTRRRFGREALEVVAGPILAGIHSGDAEKLSLASTFGQFRDMERDNGSVLLASLAAHRARRARRSDGKVTLFMTLRGGMSGLSRALEERLPRESLLLGERLSALSSSGGGWLCELEGGRRLEAGAVVLALGADAAARIVRPLGGTLSACLAEIPFASTATVSLLFARAGFPLALAGFGFVVDLRESSAVAAATFSSTKFPGQCASDRVIIRCFLGGAGREKSLTGSDEELIDRARRDLRRMLRLDVPALEARVFRWPGANPQYNCGHGALLRRIEAALASHEGLVLSGSSYKGVGVPDCVHSGREAARRLLGGRGPGFIA